MIFTGEKVIFPAFFCRKIKKNYVRISLHATAECRRAPLRRKKAGDRPVGGDRLVAQNRQRGEAADGLNIYIPGSHFNRSDQKIRKFSTSNCGGEHI